MMKKPPLKKKSVLRTASTMPEVLKIIGEESRRNGTDKLTDSQIDATINAYRKAKKNGRAG